MSDYSRREFIRTTTVVAAVTAGGLVPGAVEAADVHAAVGSAGRGKLIDTNVSLSRWPCRRLPLDETPALVTRLRSQGVKQAWAGSFDGLLHKDIASVNARLAEDCHKHGRGLLVPFGSVNPRLPDWDDDLRRCHEEHKMPGVRLHPNYHGYKLEEPAFAKLLDVARERGLIVQLVVTVEDERMQHPLMRAAHVDVAPLLGLLASRSDLRIVLLNWSRGVASALLTKLSVAGQVYFDIAMLEGVGGVANLLKQVPTDRVVFGSHAPFFYLESAVLKLKESVLSEPQLASIRTDNARRLLGLAVRGWPRLPAVLGSNGRSH
jgi:predicted TIM-barrel fold metal-dependent hydrolase